VYKVNALNLLKRPFDSTRVNLLRSALHEHLAAVPKCYPSGEEHDASEEQGAYWVKIPETFVEVNASRSNYDTNCVQQVSKNMQICGLDIQVAFFLLLLQDFRLVLIVIVMVVVFVIMAVILASFVVVVFVIMAVILASFVVVVFVIMTLIIDFFICFAFLIAEKSILFVIITEIIFLIAFNNIIITFLVEG
jgi:hypothetical protein